MSSSLMLDRSLLIAALAVIGLSGGWRAGFGDAQTVAAAPPPDAVAARATIAGPNVNVTRRTQNQHENAIAVNPVNPQQIVVLSNDEGPSGSVGLVESVSADGGKTWNIQLIATGTGGVGPACCDPTLSWDTYGNLFLGWMRQAGSNTYYAEMAYSTDGGVTVQPLGAVSDAQVQRTGPGAARTSRGPRANMPADQPTVVAGHGMVWITYANTNDGNVYARGAPVTGLGAIGAFGSAEPAPSSLNGSFGDIAIGPSGQVMVVYQKNDSAAGPDRIFVNVDADGLGAGGFGAAIEATATNVGGARVIPAQANNYGIDAEAGLAWDRSGGAHNGRVYLVYTDAANTTTNDTDIYLRTSDNNGATWSARKKINDDAGTHSQFLPRIALDQTTGHVAVIWYDSRRDLGAGSPGSTNGAANDDAELWATYSTDGGATFAPNFKVSTGVSNSWASEPAAACCRDLGYGDYIGLDYTGGYFYPAWADNSNSTGDNPDGTRKRMDVYMARLKALSADLSVTKAGPATTSFGATVLYTITVTNSGPNMAADVAVTDTLPANTTFGSLTQTSGPAFTCSTPDVGTTGTVACTIPSHATGATASFELVVAVTGLGTFTNSVNVWSASADTNWNNNTAVTVMTASGPIRLLFPVVWP